MDKVVGDGGLAFPYAEGPGLVNNRRGMSLRDWFAGQALAGIISADGTPAPDWDRCAKHAYDLADAMLEERKT